ncbi:MAG: prolipoprotein diacylglyceryl transferase [Saprospiraceae bacterium]|nr:prolipoprotein diacylglyceryl transferase [Saprospiraceae bacterium]
MYPFEFHMGETRLSGHLVFEMLAYTLGYRLYVWQRARSRDLISDEGRMWIFLGAALGAFLGSHVLGLLEHPDYLKQLNLQVWMGQKTIIGGLLGGLVGVELTKKRIGVRTSSGDLMTYPLIFALAVGRIGCHLAGLTDGTHGIPSSLPWAVDFGDGISRHPVNLYEILFLSGLAACLYWQERKQPFPDGFRFKIFMVAYLGWRFLLDYLKPVWQVPGLGLSSIQLAVMAGLAYYFWDWRKKPIFAP